MRHQGAVRVLLVLGLLASCSSRAFGNQDIETIPDALAHLQAAVGERDSEQSRLGGVRAAYAARGFSPLWSESGAPTPQAMALMRLLRSSEQYGLRSADYADFQTADAELSRGSAAGADANRTAQWDVALSSAAARFLTHVHFGRIDPPAAGFDLRFARPALPIPALLEQLSSTTNVEGVVASAEPQFYHYMLLKKALARYRLLAAGVAAPTRAELLTAPYPRRIRQIELTLERWRWLPAFDTPPIIVNIPQFRLFAFRSTADRKAEILQMDVIVGRTYPKLHTPVFSAEMKYVIFRPYWEVPYSITQREMLPSIRAKPDFLRHEHLEIVSGSGDSASVVTPSREAIEQLAAGKLRLRQQPGEDNALGLIKFVLPNPYDVYLHSTPAHRLFSRPRRAFSHGCIRVSDPVALADYVLRNSSGSWTPAAITEAMNASHSSRVNLTKPIRVLILYGTALATEDGGVSFFDDLYGHDRRLERLLQLPRLAAR